jgi:hypothetical protein
MWAVVLGEPIVFDRPMRGMTTECVLVDIQAELRGRSRSEHRAGCVGVIPWAETFSDRAGDGAAGVWDFGKKELGK